MSFETDDVSKLKPVVELREDTENHVYKTDFRGHLQLVNISEGTSTQRNVDNNKPDSSEKWTGVKPSVCSEEDQQIIISWQDESIDSCTNHVCGQLESISKTSVEEKYLIKKEISNYSSNGTWEHQMDSSSQLSDDFLLSGDLVILTQAEKKRLYRMRIKEENPAMWSTIKEKEAARKRELREKRRNIILEMQTAMESASSPDSPEVVNQQLYLDALKDRYPELWNQLVKALPETEQRNERLFIERDPNGSSRPGSKPARMYKDVIEAQKKRLYRQRIKEERPEMYERQKTRDAYARSIQRLMVKRNMSSEKMGYYSERPFPEDGKLTIPQLNDSQNIRSEKSDQHSKSKSQNDSDLLFNSSSGEVYSATDSTSLSPSLVDEAVHLAAVDNCPKANFFPCCDNNHSMNKYNVSEIPSNPCDNITNNCKESHQVNPTTNPKKLSTASSTQSDILWYWNDERSSYPSMRASPIIPYSQCRKSPRALTEEERHQKVLKERMQLKEKRKRYRLGMTAEKCSEFLEVERERLKAYRLRKKGMEVCSENIQNKNGVY